MLKKSCLRCGNCCTRFAVCVTPFDVNRIKKQFNRNPLGAQEIPSLAHMRSNRRSFEFLELLPEPPKKERDEPTIIINGDRYLLVLKRKFGDVCTFYQDGKGCEIYNVRPMLCRCYPFTYANKGNELVSIRPRACTGLWMPGKKERREYVIACNTYKSEVEQYSRWAEEWNTGTGGSLVAFLEFVLQKVSTRVTNSEVKQ